MENIKVYFYSYVKTVFSETVILVTGFLGFIVTAIVAYFVTFNSLLIGIIIFLICFFIAHISAIIRLLKERDAQKLQITELQKNTSNFDIEFNSQKLSFTEKEKYIKEEITWVEKELKDIKNINNPMYSGAINMKYVLDSLKGFSVSDADLKTYLKELQEYDDFISDLKQYKLLRLSTMVKNIGSLYDEKILIKIKSEEVIFMYYIDLSLNRLDDLPERPKSLIERSMHFSTNALLPSFEPKPINEMEIKSKKELHLIIPTLHINDTTCVEDKDVLLVLNKDTTVVNLDLEIVTKNTRTPLKIEKKLIFE
jgi:hypothetical protein